MEFSACGPAGSHETYWAPAWCPIAPVFTCWLWCWPVSPQPTPSQEQVSAQPPAAAPPGGPDDQSQSTTSAAEPRPGGDQPCWHVQGRPGAARPPPTSAGRGVALAKNPFAELDVGDTPAPRRPRRARLRRRPLLRRRRRRRAQPTTDSLVDAVAARLLPYLWGHRGRLMPRVARTVSRILSSAAMTVPKPRPMLGPA